MNPIETKEIESRVLGLRSGPWSVRAEKVMTDLMRPSGTVDRDTIASAKTIRLESLLATPKDMNKDIELHRALRSHYIDGPVTDAEEIELRDALDGALLQAQLYELAIQAGYVSTDAMWAPARELLTGLLWSESARAFLVTYEYPAVPLLAQRVAVHGLKNVRATSPSTRPTDALRFAGFLAHLRSFYDDPSISEWTRFLDDFIVERNEQNRFWDYLNGDREVPTVRSEKLVEGALAFVESLSNTYDVFDKRQYACFGLPHAYWLQKFFGYELAKTGYVRDPLFKSDTSWASTLIQSERLAPGDAKSEIAELARSKLTEDVRLLASVFSAVRAVVAESRNP